MAEEAKVRIYSRLAFEKVEPPEFGTCGVCGCDSPLPARIDIYLTPEGKPQSKTPSGFLLTCASCHGAMRPEIEPIV